MTDDTEKKEDETNGPVGGERLRKARRENDISVRDIAKELHLDEYKVRALEKNEFDVLGAPVFAKGHLRKYAELVGVDIDDVMTDYYQMNRASSIPPVVGPKRRMPRTIDPMPWLAGAIVLILVASIAYWWFGLRSPDGAAIENPERLMPFVEEEAGDPAPARQVEALPARAESAAEEPASGPDSAEAGEDVAAEAAVDADSPPLDTAEPAVAETTAEDDEVAANDAEAGYTPTPGAPQVELRLAFEGDCWTEISDASGRRLFYELGREGRVVTLSGDAPLRVILGDAENVSLAVEGNPWPIPASALRGRLARLTIAAP